MDKAILTRTQEQLQHLRKKGKEERAKSFPIPTLDGVVREWLRSLKEPITRFGEGPWDRRERLRKLLTEHSSPEEFIKKHSLLTEGVVHGSISDSDSSLNIAHNDFDEFWVPGSKDLLLPLRSFLYNFSNNSISKRNEKIAKNKLSSFEEEQILIEEVNSKVNKIKMAKLVSSEIFGDSPLVACEIIRGVGDILIGDSDGIINRFNPSSGQIVNSFKMDSKISCIKGNRSADLLAFSDFGGQIGIVSGVASTINFLSSNNTQRIPRIQFHPSNRLLASSSIDGSWRLWDTQIGKELQWQEGHKKGVFGIDFHRDGSIVSTGGLDGLVRLWDCRIGKCIWTTKKDTVYDVSFHPNGNFLSSSISNGTILVWDVRNLSQEIQILPASSESSIVSSMMFEGITSEEGGKNEAILITGSFDKSIKVWNTSNRMKGNGGWSPILEKKDHSGRITCTSISFNDGIICSTSIDKTLKIYSF